jgi:hypothetical protein
LESEIQVVTYNTSQGIWQQLPIVSQDTVNKTITVSTNHFCTDQVVVPKIISDHKVAFFTIDGLSFAETICALPVLQKLCWNYSQPPIRMGYLQNALIEMNMGLYYSDIYSYGSGSGRDSWNGDATKTSQFMQDLIIKLSDQYAAAKKAGKKFVLVTHSWGTVLGMLALQYIPNIDPDLIITLSSPLGSQYVTNYDYNNFLISIAGINNIPGISVADVEFAITQFDQAQENATINALNDLSRHPIKYHKWINYFDEGDIISGPILSEISESNNTKDSSSPDVEDHKIGIYQQRDVYSTICAHAITSLEDSYWKDEGVSGDFFREQVKNDIISALLFSDSNLETAIRVKINKPAPTPITIADLQNITGDLNLSSTTVSNLNGLQYCTNITSLEIAGTAQLTDLTPLAGLTKLKSLSLNSGTLTNLTPLQSLTNLTFLDLFNDQVSDITALGNLKKLITLELGNNQITNISPIQGLDNLDYLYLDYNQITDISPLLNNTGLSSGTTISLGNNPLSDASYFTDIPQLISRGVAITLPAPSIPTNFNVVYQSDHKWNYLTWNNLGSGLQYQVYWDTKSGVTKSSEKLALTQTNNYAHSGVGAGYTYYYKVSSINAAGVESDLSSEQHVTVSSGIDLTNGLVAYYPFNGNANDESGHGHNGAVYGATLVPDRFGNPNSAYQFDGTDAYVQLPNATTPLNTFSITAFIKMTGLKQETQYLLSDYGVGFLIDTGGYLRLIRYTNSQGAIIATSNVPIGIGTYHCVAATYDGNNIRLYIDGEMAGSPVISTGYLDSPDTVSETIGKRYNNPCYFYGSIDDVRIYNRALSDAELQALYNQNINLSQGLVAYYPFNGNANDVSGNGNNGVIHGNPSFVEGKSDKAIYFNNPIGNTSITQYVTIPSSNIITNLGNSSLTIAMLYSSTDTGRQNGRLLGNAVLFGDSGVVMDYNCIINPQAFSYIGDGVNGYHVAKNSDANPYALTTDGQWHWQVLVLDRDKKVLKQYIDNHLIDTDNITALSTVNFDNLILGATKSSDTYGARLTAVDEVRIYNRTLSEDEVQALYSQTSNSTFSAGNPVDSRAIVDIGDGINFIDATSIISSNGLLYSWSFYSPNLNTRQVELYILRPAADGGYDLIGKSGLVSPYRIGVNTFPLSGIAVNHGDRLGWWYPRGQGGGVIAFDYTGNTVFWHWPHDTDTEIQTGAHVSPGYFIPYYIPTENTRTYSIQVNGVVNP